MAFKISKRTVSISEDSYSYGCDSVSTTKEDEKTIPFLRRLVDMLSENDEVISFYAGDATSDGQVTLGRIVVHDRLKVEADVLPRYFNHSSFASLRRQLNYFSFTRLGKGRQRGATYCNEAVVELDDILRLKRRSATVGAARESILNSQQRTPSMPPKGGPRCVSDSSLSGDRNEQPSRPIKKRHSESKNNTSRTFAPTLISPRSSPVIRGSSATEGPPQITLDLTVPSQQRSSQDAFVSSHHYTAQASNSTPRVLGSDADVLAGCRVLLSIRSLRPEEISLAL